MLKFLSITDICGGADQPKMSFLQTSTCVGSRVVETDPNNKFRVTRRKKNVFKMVTDYFKFSTSNLSFQDQKVSHFSGLTHTPTIASFRDICQRCKPNTWMSFSNSLYPNYCKIFIPICWGDQFYVIFLL